MVSLLLWFIAILGLSAVMAYCIHAATPTRQHSAMSIADTYRSKLARLEDHVLHVIRADPLRVETTRVFPCHVYYINLDSATARNAFMRAQFEMYNHRAFTRIQAVDGRTRMPSMLGDRPVMNYLSALRKPEVGCLLSHIRAIARAYADGHEVAIILEDDAYFKHAVLWKPDALARIISSAPSDWRIISFACLPSHAGSFLNHMITAARKQYEGSGRGYAKFEGDTVNGMLAMAYVINRDGMRAILDRIGYDTGVIRLPSAGFVTEAADSILFHWADRMYFSRPTTLFPHNDPDHGIVTAIQPSDDITTMHRAALYVLDQYVPDDE